MKMLGARTPAAGAGAGSGTAEVRGRAPPSLARRLGMNASAGRCGRCPCTHTHVLLLLLVLHAGPRVGAVLPRGRIPLLDAREEHPDRAAVPRSVRGLLLRGASVAPAPCALLLCDVMLHAAQICSSRVLNVADAACESKHITQKVGGVKVKSRALLS
jgi:hypothetical protein